MSDSLADIWKIKSRAKKDSERHKELVEKAIRKNGKDLITEYNIIKSDGTKKIKVPLKFLDKYQFKYGKISKDGGTGQGMPGVKPGQTFKKQPGKDSNGQPGTDEGEDIYSAEISIDELVNIMMDELDLPWMDPKNISKEEIENEELNSIEKIGIYALLDKKQTILQNIKRNAAKGKAEVKNIANDDLRFRSWDTQIEYHSNAVVYVMMDRSGSMSENKVKWAKTFYFWVAQFLKKRYKSVEIIFIAHDISARIVEEDEFFKILPSGGTKCSSSFEVAYEHMNLKYPADDYNIYVIEASDGDNYADDNINCVDIINKLVDYDVKAVGYLEIMPNDDGMSPWVNYSNLLSKYINDKIKRTRVVSMLIRDKDEIYDALKKFFNVGAKNE